MGHSSSVFAVYILFPLRLFDKTVLTRKEIEEQMCFLESPEPTALERPSSGPDAPRLR